MQIKISNQSGSVLLEGVIALMILCLTVVSVMLLAGMILNGRQQTDTVYEEAFALNSLRDQIAEKIQRLPEKEPAAIASAVGCIVAGRKGWGFQLISEESGLITLLLRHESADGCSDYKIQIFASP